jgi:hypothetical protein
LKRREEEKPREEKRRKEERNRELRASLRLFLLH